MNSTSLTPRITFRPRLFAGITLAGSLGLATFAEAGRDPYSRIVTIGDSLSDTGNFFALTGGNVPPPPYYMGRFSDGPLWTEQLAEQLGMELLPEDQYAVAGAFTGAGNLNGPFPGTDDQVAALLDDHPAGLESDALFTVWIGANDFFATLQYVESLDPADPDYTETATQAFLSMVGTGVANTVSVVATLADSGARHILVVNLPDLGVTPLGTDGGPAFSATLSAWVDGYNQALADALEGLAAAGTPTIHVDAAGLLREMVAGPDAFDLTNVTDQGIWTLIGGGDPAGYLFWDNVHPASAGHAGVAQRAIDELVAFYSEGGRHASRRALHGLIRSWRVRHRAMIDPVADSADNSRRLGGISKVRSVRRALTRSARSRR